MSSILSISYSIWLRMSLANKSHFYVFVSQTPPRDKWLVFKDFVVLILVCVLHLQVENWSTQSIVSSQVAAKCQFSIYWWRKCYNCKLEGEEKAIKVWFKQWRASSPDAALAVYSRLRGIVRIILVGMAESQPPCYLNLTFPMLTISMVTLMAGCCLPHYLGKRQMIWMIRRFDF